jgi:hypothetical protein
MKLSKSMEEDILSGVVEFMSVNAFSLGTQF